MTYDQMKYELGDYLRCKRIYERHKRELALTESKMKSAGISVDYSKPRIKSSVAGNAAYAHWIEEAMFIRKQLEAEAKEVIAAKDALIHIIDRLESQDQKDILRYKYLNGWPWYEIGRVMNYSPEWARHVCYQAIRILADKTTTHNHP